MKIGVVKITDWGKGYNCDMGDSDLQVGDMVVINIEGNHEIGKIFKIKHINDEEVQDREDLNLVELARKAGKDDFEKMASKEEEKQAFKDCVRMIREHGLSMKLIGVHFSLNRKRINFAFASENRVDFRELLKSLTSHFRCMIRLTQIGIRDETKMVGDCGRCGQELCCKRFINEFKSITSEMAELQQISLRGSDRASGVCGRLMCCLGFEQKAYEEMAKKLPPIGSSVKTQNKRGVVVGHNVLKQSINVEVPAEDNGGKNGADKGDSRKTVVVEVDWE